MRSDVMVWKLKVYVESTDYEDAFALLQSVSEEFVRIRKATGGASDDGGIINQYSTMIETPMIERIKQLRQEADDLETRYNLGEE